MKKKTIYRNLILSASAATMTAVCLTATTFAWFSRNDNVWLDAPSISMQWDDGILISTDGVNFQQDISASQIKKVIAGSEAAYDKLAFDGTTLKLDNDGNIVYDENGKAVFEHDNVLCNPVSVIEVVNQETGYKAQFYFEVDKTKDFTDLRNINIKANSDNVGMIPTNFGDHVIFSDSEAGYGYTISEVEFSEDYHIKNATVTIIKNDTDVTDEFDKDITFDNDKYRHESNISNKNDEEDARYITFDLYFRLTTEGSTSSSNFSEQYKLKFLDRNENSPSNAREFITAKDSKVKLQNSFTGYQNGEVKTFTAGDEINVNVANAMRLGVQGGAIDGLKVYERTNDLDLGSTALYSPSDLKHNPAYNAMYNYYNALFPKYPLQGGKQTDVETDDNYFDDTLGIFQYNYEEEKYNDIKLTFYIWLEGWDADYLYGIDKDGRKVSLYLEFGYEK